MQQDPSNISPIKTIHDFAHRNKILPEYQLKKESGPAHAKIYTIQLQLGEKQYTGEGRSIKSAQRAAAETALADQKPLLPAKVPKESPQIYQSPTVALNTWATQNHILAQYVFLHEQYLSLANTRPQIIFTYRLHIGHDLFFDGYGTSHQRARINCAYHALNFIQQNQTFPLFSPSTENQTKSQISLMYERARQLGLSVQMEHNEPSIVTYRIGEEYSTTGTGPTKHAAKESAAERMLEILPLPTEKSKTKANRKHTNQRQKFIEQKGSSNYSVTEQINPITRLYQIGRARNAKVEFTHTEKSASENLFHFHVTFGEEESAEGLDKNKQAAKRLAAENLLLKLNVHSNETAPIALPPPPKKGLLKREEHSAKQSQEKKHVHFIEDQLTSIKEQLARACERLDIRIAFDEQLTAADQYESILSLTKDDRLLAKFRGNASLVADAQEKASVAAWNNLRDLFRQPNQ